jgi:hypothetical protein
VSSTFSIRSQGFQEAEARGTILPCEYFPRWADRRATGTPGSASVYFFFVLAFCLAIDVSIF